MRPDRLLILGNGGAAVTAACSAREAGHRGEIHLVSDVDGPAFNPMLSPYFLKGAIPWERCFPFGSEWYRDYDIACHFGAAVESLDVRNGQAALTCGLRLPYDRCLVATGARPVLPPVPGLEESDRVHVVRTAASVKRLDHAIPSARHAVVLGASFVGLKAAEILTKRGIHVTLLDVADRVLPLGTHRACAALIRSLFESRGVEVRLGCSMEGMEPAGEGVACRFEDNVIREADFVVVCTGVRPNTDFIDPSQVRIDKGILVNDRMETNVPGLYAAGDVSQGVNLLSGSHEWAGTWANARLQGRTAGRNMTGQDAVCPGFVPRNTGPFFDWTFAQLGDMAPGESTYHAFGDAEREGHIVLAFRDHLLVGANLVNCTHLAGRLEEIVSRKRQYGRLLRGAASVRDVENALDAAIDGMIRAKGLNSAPG